jgi:glycosyltransferase involved in cell wall biosynthesis
MFGMNSLLTPYRLPYNCDAAAIVSLRFRSSLKQYPHMKLSVAMITYNHEEFIGQAIESVLAQKVNFDYELVIGEDCSTDGTRAVILDFQRRYPDRIVALSSERNLGVMRNFTRTIGACRGQYMAMLEGDDYWTSSDKLQRQVDFLEGHPAWNICCTRAHVKNEAKIDSSKVRVPTGTVFPARPNTPRSSEEDLSGLLPVTPRAAGTYTLDDLLMENFIPTCTVVYRWNTAIRFPWSFAKLSLGDLPLHVMVAGRNKIELLDDCTATYRIHPGGSWSARDRASQVRENTRMLAALSRHLGGKYRASFRPGLAASYLDFAMTARQEGQRIETAKYLLLCLRNGGLELPDSSRLIAGLATYILIGSSYKIFSRAKPQGDN